MDTPPQFIDGIPVIHAVPEVEGMEIVAYQPLFARRPVVLDRNRLSDLLPLPEPEEVAATRREPCDWEIYTASYLEGLRQYGPAGITRQYVAHRLYWPWIEMQPGWITEQFPTAKKIGELLTSYPFKPRRKNAFLRSTQIVSATYLWLIEQSGNGDAVRRYFSDVVEWEGMGEGKESPAYLLRKYLPETVIDSGRHHVPERLSWTIVRCFNSWADDADDADKIQMFHQGQIRPLTVARPGR